jgi:DNA polymerase
MNLTELNNLISNCRKCDLYKTRTNTVPGDGNKNADIFFIGEAPGKNEDIQGKPFVGRAGKILDELLKFINLNRKDIFIGNILKCRPPQNRNPHSGEIETCTSYLDKQIEIINPKVIVPLGNFATQYIFEKFNLSKEKISNVHGKKFEIEAKSIKIIIFPVFHPAVVTYNPNKMSLMKDDFQKILECI